MPDQSSELLTVDELADYLKVPKGTVYAWRARQYGPPATKLGKQLRYQWADVQRWLDEQKPS